MKAKLILLSILAGCWLMPASGLAAACPTAVPTTVAWTGTVVDTWEAESGTRSGNMAVCCGGIAVGETSGSGTSTLTLQFTTAVSDDFKVEVYVANAANGHNTYSFGITGRSSFTPDCNVTDSWSIDYSSGSTYAWRYITSSNVVNTNTNARVWTLPAGTYSLVLTGGTTYPTIDKVRIYEKNPPSTPTPTSTSTPIPGNGTGLCGTYYNNMTLSSPSVLTRLDSTVNFDWGSGSPAGTVNVDSFSAQWIGQIEIPQDGTYNFYTNSDDGVILTINGVTMISDWTNHGAVVDASAATVMTAGKYSIIMQYYENTGSALAQLMWASSNGITQTAVPMVHLYNSGCVAPTPTKSPTPAIIPPTPTRTPTSVVPVWQGLVGSERLYGMEYIPFPENVSGSNYFYDLAMTFTAAANNIQPKNTARWKIQFTNLSSIGSQIEVETRIGPYGVTCSAGYYNAANNTSSLSLPSRPANLSTTYFWVDGSGPTIVPATEQHDTMGDPRYVPYLDMMGAPTGMNFANYYNWFFKDLGDNTQVDYRSIYATFAPMAQWDHYAGNSNSDVPAQFAYWRLGVQRDASIYTSMTGWDSYYIGIGGEIGGDSANELGGSALGTGSGVPMKKSPWGSSSSAGENEITSSSSLVRNSGNTWRSMPFIGELWPDSAYATDWSYNAISTTAWGNLRNTQASPIAGSWLRDAWQNCDVATALTYTGGNFVWSQVEHINGPPGCATFLNGNGNGSSSSTFNHYGEDNTTANLLADGQALSLAYNYPMPATFNISRPWGLNAGGNTPNEWSQVPYSNNRASLGLYSASTQTAALIGFYSRQTSNISDNTTQRASAAIRGEDTVNHLAGWFIVNGLAPSTQSGINFVAQFAVLSCLRTFHDAGAPTASAVPQSAWANTKNKVGSNTYRIEPVPLVEILHPNGTDKTTGLSTIAIEWDERYARWDGGRYTENYPCLDSYGDTSTVGPCSPHSASSPDNPSYEWHSSTPLEYMLKYSEDNGITWKTVTTPTAQCQIGYEYNPPNMTGLPSGHIITEPSSLHDFTWNWDVSALPVGNKLVRVECYRSNINQHYAYHQVPVYVSP